MTLHRVLETERLRLREFQERDVEDYLAIYADPEVMRYLGGNPMTRQEAWRNLAMVLGHWQLRGFGMFAVEEKATGKLVGRIGPWQPEDWPGFEIGWSLARQAWGKGYALEAAIACRDLVFGQWQKPEFISCIHPENQRSIRVAERLGERFWKDDSVLGHPIKLYRMTRQDWLATR